MPGELAALATAICWTGSSLFFALATRRAGGIPTNQFRLLAAVPCLLVLHQVLLGTLWPGLSGERLGLLVASGLAGLVIGDIGYFYALGAIGPRLGSVLMATWPAMATAITWAFLGDRPSLAMAAGIVVTMGGVVLVLLRGRDGVAWNADLAPGKRNLAMAGALLGALGQAVGSVLVGAAAAPGADAPAGVPGLSCALVRMVAAAVGITLVALLQGQGFAWRAVVVDRRALGAALGGMVFGPVLGVWLSMVALAHARIGIAATLMATTPVFMMPVARFVYGARIGFLGAVGTVLAVLGVGLLMLQCG
jgi:drug/metabolite transporter (DMT)-like permease